MIAYEDPAIPTISSCEREGGAIETVDGGCVRPVSSKGRAVR